MRLVVGCHAKCEEYIAYAKWRSESNERASKAKRIEKGFYNAATRRRKKER